MNRYLQGLLMMLLGVGIGATLSCLYYGWKIILYQSGKRALSLYSAGMGLYSVACGYGYLGLVLQNLWGSGRTLFTKSGLLLFPPALALVIWGLVCGYRSRIYHISPPK